MDESMDLVDDRPPGPRALIVIDGANVAWSAGRVAHPESPRPVPAAIITALRFFLRRGHTAVAFVPEGRQWLANAGSYAERVLSSYVASGMVVFTPRDDNDDAYMISYAREHDGWILSNDRYRDHATAWAVRYGTCAAEELRTWVAARVISYTWRGDELLPEPDKSRAAALMMMTRREADAPPLQLAPDEVMLPAASEAQLRVDAFASSDGLTSIPAPQRIVDALLRNLQPRDARETALVQYVAATTWASALSVASASLHGEDVGIALVAGVAVQQQQQQREVSTPLVHREPLIPTESKDWEPAERVAFAIVADTASDALAKMSLLALTGTGATVTVVTHQLAHTTQVAKRDGSGLVGVVSLWDPQRRQTLLARAVDIEKRVVSDGWNLSGEWPPRAPSQVAVAGGQRSVECTLHDDASHELADDL